MVEQTLITSLQNSDPDAFRQVYDRYAGKLYHYCLKICKSPALAEDVVQDVFLRVWDKRQSINADLSLQSYLFTIARNQLLTLIKRATKEAEIINEMMAYASVGHDATTQAMAHQESTALIDRAISSLPAQRQRIFRLSREEGLSYAEIANTMGLAKGTVNGQLVKALKSIRDYLTLSEVAVVLCALLSC